MLTMTTSLLLFSAFVFVTSDDDDDDYSLFISNIFSNCINYYKAC